MEGRYLAALHTVDNSVVKFKTYVVNGTHNVLMPAFDQQKRQVYVLDNIAKTVGRFGLDDR